jgi:hypothetical protein
MHRRHDVIMHRSPRRDGNFYYTLTAVQHGMATNQPGFNNHTFSRHSCGGGESKRLVVESPRSHFTSECQRF